jgi:hypothetical protein
MLGNKDTYIYISECKRVLHCQLLQILGISSLAYDPKDYQSDFFNFNNSHVLVSLESY